MNRTAHRAALKANLKAKFIPHLNAVGFESTRRKATKDAWRTFNLGYDYGRRREDQIDLLSVRWARYGEPWFVVDFATYAVADLIPPALPKSWRSGELMSGHYALPWRLVGLRGRWFGRGQDPSLAVDLAIHRMAELEAFLRRGIGSRDVYLVQTSYGDLAGGPLSTSTKMLLGVLWLVGLPFRLLWKLLEGRREPGR